MKARAPGFTHAHDYSLTFVRKWLNKAGLDSVERSSGPMRACLARLVDVHSVNQAQEEIVKRRCSVTPEERSINEEHERMQKLGMTVINEDKAV